MYVTASIMKYEIELITNSILNQNKVVLTSVLIHHAFSSVGFQVYFCLNVSAYEICLCKQEITHKDNNNSIA